MNTKLGFFPYEAMNYKAAQRWLDRKARRGWALSRVYLGCIAHLQRQERPSHFVDLDIRKDYWDENHDYFQLCYDAGWEQLQSLRGMLLFRAAPGKSPAPIQTDGEIEWERFCKKYRPHIWSILRTLVCVALIAFLLSLRVRMISYLTSNLSILCLLVLLSTGVCALSHEAYCWWYLNRCRRSRHVEDPGSLCTFLDAAYRLILFMFWLFFAISPILPIGGTTVGLDWYPAGGEYSATVEACQKWPVLMASDLDLPAGERSRHLHGRRSVLVDFLEYQETASGEGSPLYILTTERYDCLSKHLAKLIIAQLWRETQNGAFPWGELDWEPAPGLGFDESYTCREGAYLLLRQGNVVALVGCTGLDLTSGQGLSTLRERVLNGP